MTIERYNSVTFGKQVLKVVHRFDVDIYIFDDGCPFNFSPAIGQSYSKIVHQLDNLQEYHHGHV